MRAKLNHLVLMGRAAIQSLRGFERHARRMIDTTAIAAEFDAIDYSALSNRPEFIDANRHLAARLTGLAPVRCTLKRETERGLPREEHGGALSVES